MKILQINSVVNSGSTGKIAEAIGKEILSRGWSSTIAYGRRLGRQKSSSNLFRIGGRWSQFLHLMSTRLFDNHGLFSTRATKKLIRLIDRENFDIVHIHNLHGYYVNYEILLSYLAKTEVRVVWTLHDCWSFTGHCSYFERVGCQKWVTECKSCPQLQTYPRSLLKDRSNKNFLLKKALFKKLDYLTIVSVSNWLNSYVSRSIMGEKTLEVLHNGIDVSTFKPMPMDSNELLKLNNAIGDSFVLAVANVWTVHKGFNDLFELRKKMPNDIQLVVVGVTSKQKRLLTDGMVGIERTENVHQLAMLYSAARVLVNPTYEDNFPTINLESMSCGTPVVAYDTGGCKEAITSETGIIVETGNIDSLSKGVHYYIDINNYGKVSQNCRTRAKTHFNQNKVFKRYISFYENITNR